MLIKSSVYTSSQLLKAQKRHTTSLLKLCPRPHSRCLNLLNRLLQIFHIIPAQTRSCLPRQMRINHRNITHNIMIHCTIKIRNLQPILPAQPFRKPLGRQQPCRWAHRLQPDWNLLRMQQFLAQAACPIRHFQRLDVVVPVHPEVIERRGPHLGWHAQRGAVDGGFFKERFHLLVAELAEEGFVHDKKRYKERGGGPFVKLRVIGRVSVTFDGGVGAVDDRENGFFLFGSSVDTDVEKSGRRLKAIQDTRGEVGVLKCALSKARMCKLAKDSILATEEEDAFVGVVKDFLGFGNGREGFGLLVWSLFLLGHCSACVSRWASHFDRNVALRGGVG